MTDDWVASVRSIEDARLFVQQVGVCGILQDKTGAPTLWDAVDAPNKQPGESGWGDKMGLVWSWKNELPARYPTEVFYGKRKSGAMLCTFEKLAEMYKAAHKDVSYLGDLPRKLISFIAKAPVTNRELRLLAGLTDKAHKSAFDRAMNDLQLTFNIVRVNRLDVEGDTWTPFSEQYPDVYKELSG